MIDLITATIKSDNPPSDEIIEKALNSPHKSWDTYDIQLEGHLFYIMHELVQQDQFNPKLAATVLDKLTVFAKSNGYGVADTTYNSLSAPGSDDNYQDFISQIFLKRLNQDEHDDESPYFYEILQSEKALKKAARTPEALAFLGLTNPHQECFGAIWRAMNDGYNAGRDQYAETLTA
jgi:hypothetical protein